MQVCAEAHLLQVVSGCQQGPIMICHKSGSTFHDHADSCWSKNVRLSVVEVSSIYPRQEFPMPDKGVICISGGNGALGLVMGNWLLDKARYFQPSTWHMAQ